MQRRKISNWLWGPKYRRVARHTKGGSVQIEHYHGDVHKIELTDRTYPKDAINFKLSSVDGVEGLLSALFAALLDPVMERIGWRGQADSRWPIRTGMFRRLSRQLTNGAIPSAEDLNEYKIDLISRSMSLKYYSDDYAETWAKLQHHGAATHLLDISRDPFVALWFAASGAIQRDSSGYASLYGLNLSRMIPLTVFDGVSSGHFMDEEILSQGIVYTPAWTNERVKAQRASFLCWEGFDSKKEQLSNQAGTLENGLEIRFPTSMCYEILDFLKVKFDITEMSLFPDMDGFAMSHSVERDPIPKNQLQRFG